MQIHPPSDEDTAGDISPTLNGALELLVERINEGEYDAAADDDVWAGTDLVKLWTASPRGGFFRSRSSVWVYNDQHPYYRDPPQTMNVADKQEYNFFQVDLFGCIGAEPRVGPLGRSGGPNAVIPMRIEEARKVNCALNLMCPPDAEGFKDVWQDQAANLQSEVQKFVVSLGNEANSLSVGYGFFAQDASKTDVDKLTIPILFGPLYGAQEGFVEKVPTLQKSPRKKRAAEEEEIPEVPELSLDEKIAEQERLHPHPNPETTTYPLDTMPGAHSALFTSPGHMVVKQQSIKDVDGHLVKPWNVRRVLTEGTLVTVRVVLKAWIVKERVFLQPLAKDIQILFREGPPSYWVPPEDLTPIDGEAEESNPFVATKGVPATDNGNAIASSSTLTTSSTRTNRKAARTENSTRVPTTGKYPQQQMDVDDAHGPNDLNAPGV